MLSISAIRPLNRIDTIRPGPVSSVGDVNMGEKLKSSLPGNYRPGNNYGSQGPRVGSSSQDGAQVGYFSHGGSARVVDNTWNGKRGFRTEIGWFHQDLRAPDKLLEPMVGSLPKYSWLNKIARIKSETGKLYPYHEGGLIERPHGGTRGGMYPRVTNVEPGDSPAGGFQNPDDIFLGLPRAPVRMGLGTDRRRR